jgi:hypothetical protein
MNSSFCSQNLVSHRAAQPDESTRVYTVPYIIDTNAAQQMPGIRVHWPVIQASDRNVQMVNDFKNGISLGTLDTSIQRKYKVDQEEDLSLLAVSLRWSSGGDDEDDEASSMVSHIVRGMPYATMRYFGGVLPSLYSYNAHASLPLIDGTIQLECGVLGGDGQEEAGSTVTAYKEVQLHFFNSDFTWIVFFSQPVDIQCAVSEGDEKTAEFFLNITSYSTDEENPLTVRLALIDQCTTGKSDLAQHCDEKAEWKDQEGYIELLRSSSHVFPTSPTVDFEYPEGSNKNQETRINFDWAAKTTVADETHDLEELVMFALPHHQEQLDLSQNQEITDFCIPTFHGKTCLVKGEKWSLSEDSGYPQSFTARRPPEASTIPLLADALSKDIHYQLSDNMLRGAADTYFSGKILSKLARIIIVASEMKQLAKGSPSLRTVYDDIDDDTSLRESIEAAAAVDLPSDKIIAAAVEQLKKGVQIWLEDAEAPYIYDRTWGGLVNCGCRYSSNDDKGYCNNTFPDCPALASVNEDFGNGKITYCKSASSA